MRRMRYPLFGLCGCHGLAPWHSVARQVLQTELSDLTVSKDDEDDFEDEGVDGEAGVEEAIARSHSDEA